MDILNFPISILLTLFTTTIIIIIAKTYIKLNNTNFPPGPSPLPFIGNLHQLGPKPHITLAKLAKIHGPIMTLKLGQITTIVISSASSAKLVLQKQDHSFANRSIPDSVTVSDHHKYSIAWIPLSPKWRYLRKLCITLIFSSNKMEANGYIIQNMIKEFISDMRKKCAQGDEGVLIGEIAFKTSMNMLSRLFLSIDLADEDSETAREFKKSFWDIMMLSGCPNLVDFFPWLRWIDPQRIRTKMEPQSRKITYLLDGLIDERLMKRRSEEGCGKNEDVLDSLLNIVEESGEELTRNDINHLLQDLFVAGTDTTASTMEWAMSEILKNPNILKKAKTELQQVTSKGKPIHDADIPNLPYLKAIINETLRLHPATPLLLPRKTLNEVELNGYKIPKGAQVIVNAWTIARDCVTWENPECFVPERFLGLDSVSFVSADFETIPFGGGRRICPGMPLAIKMLQLMLGSVLNCFEWKVDEGVEMDMDDKFGITLQKNVPLRVFPLAIDD